jgi:ferredoxin
MAKVRYLAHGKTWEADGAVGMSLRDVSKTVDAPQGDACGGVCACSTCHVHVLKGKEFLSEAEEEEEDILDKAFDVRSNSRLGCQSVIQENAGDDAVIEVEITRESLDAYYNEHPQVEDPRKKR